MKVDFRRTSLHLFTLCLVSSISVFHAAQLRASSQKTSMWSWSLIKQAYTSDPSSTGDTASAWNSESAATTSAAAGTTTAAAADSASASDATTTATAAAASDTAATTTAATAAAESTTLVQATAAANTASATTNTAANATNSSANACASSANGTNGTGGACATLIAAAVAGDTTLNVASNDPFKVGDTIVIEQGTAQQEVNSVKGFGSLLLSVPLVFPHAAGVAVSVLASAPNASNCDNASAIPAVNNSGLIAQQQQMAQLSAQAASSALAKIQNAAAVPSATAEMAGQQAQQAAAVWIKAFDFAKQAKLEAGQTTQEIKTLNKIYRKASQAYSTQINKVQIPPPHFPLMGR